MAFFKKISVIVLLASLPLLGHAQDKGISKKDQDKIQAKKEKEREKGEKQAEKELMKHHLDIQDKKTRKRLKKNQRKSKSQTHHKKEPFWNGWFTHKR